ncbi:MAG: hypothetical protein ACRDZ7_19290 [Acidimicrobiia bacterium]
MSPRSAVSGAALLAFSWWATGIPPFTGVAYAVVVGSGTAAMAWGVRHSRPPERAWAARGLLGWAALGTVLVIWQVGAFVQHPRFEHPTLSSMANVVLEPQPVRALALALWLAAAYHLARRRR